MLIVIALTIIKWLFFVSGLTFSYGAFLLVKFEYFAIGGATVALLSAAKIHSMDRVVAVFGAIALMFCVVSLWKSEGGITLAFSICIWGSVWGIVLFGDRASARPFRLLGDVLRSKALVSLGEISYSTYIVHALAIDLVVFLFVRYLGQWQSGPFVFGISLSIVVVTFLSSILLHRIVEVPGMRLGVN